jgi:hypothetical protein
LLFSWEVWGGCHLIERIFQHSGWTFWRSEEMGFPLYNCPRKKVIRRIEKSQWFRSAASQ